jgi:L-ascorbate metabolism protein UlaG (beta-lactamase superfamily)
MTSTRITYLGHATVFIEMDGVRIMTDPLLNSWAGPLRRRSPPVAQAHYQHTDAVLISHQHLDHLHVPSLRTLDPSTRIIVPRGAESLLRASGFQRVEGVRAGDSASVGPLTIAATPANHPRDRYPLGPPADPLGYRIEGRHSVYFAGDTALFPEMDAVGSQLDLALLGVWGWGPTLGPGHMDPRDAARALRMLNPSLAVPIHWGTYYPLGRTWMGPVFVPDPAAAFARHAARLAPAVRVQVVPPGQAISLG